MWIAHLPAGYLLAKASGRFEFWQALSPPQRWIWLTFVAIGSVLPDVELLILGRASYGHLPLAILSACLGLWILVRLIGSRVTTAYVSGAVAGIVLHLILDTWVSGIAWLWPILDHPFALIQVPDLYGNSALNQILHGSFALEIVIVLVALWRLGAGPSGEEDL